MNNQEKKGKEEIKEGHLIAVTGFGTAIIVLLWALFRLIFGRFNETDQAIVIAFLGITFGLVIFGYVHRVRGRTRILEDRLAMAQRDIRDLIFTAKRKE